MVLFAAYHNKIVAIDPTSKDHVREVISNATEASGLDFHLAKRIIFYTDTEKKKIYKDLLEYCRLDTEGLLIIYKSLLQLISL